MEIEILSVPDCPNLAVMRSRLDEALGAGGIEASVRQREIVTAADAEAAGMRGSPTLLIDGHDPFPAGVEAGSLSCRLYRNPEGGPLGGAPSVAQLLEALGQPAAR